MNAHEPHGVALRGTSDPARPLARRIFLVALALAPMLVSSVSACGQKSSGTDVQPQQCETTFPTTGADPGYRVVITPPTGSEGASVFPAADSSWTLTYVFTVPPLPCAATWNHNDQVFYVWGDVDWDDYGARGQYPLSSYRFNQIVPQATIGNALDGNDAGYHPTWQRLDHWIVQAQYFWMSDDGTPYAQAGDIVPVSPGDEVTTRIRYDADAGTITASIGTADATSSIVSERPFPNESPSPFSSWRDFFEQAAAQSTTLLGHPKLNVESHRVDQAGMCSVLPWHVSAVSLADGPLSSAQLKVTRNGAFTCTGDGLASLDF